MTDRLSVPARAAGRVARRRPMLVGACLLALVLTGCGATTGASTSSVTVNGSTLDIWASQPPGDTGGQTATEVLDAEQLAFDRAKKKIDGFTLQLKITHAYEVSQDARNAVSDKSSIAYLGESVPGTSGVSVQITNEVGLLQVSPTDTAAYLTQSTPGVPNSPDHFYPTRSTYSKTFGRVVPTTAAEAKAIVAKMKSDGVGSLYVEHDSSDYGVSVADEVTSAARTAGITVSGSASGAGAILYAGEPTTAAVRALDAAASSAPRARLFAPSALYEDSLVSQLSAAAQKALTVSAPGFLSSALDSVGQSFVSAFEQKYRLTPVPQAIFGYEAMRAVLAAVAQSGDHAAVRQAVIANFRDLTRPASQSALGAYRLSDGDTNISPFVFAGVSGGSLVPRSAG